MAGGLDKELIEAAAQALCDGAAGEMSALLQVGVEFSLEGIDTVEAEGVAEADEPIVVVMCRSDGQPPTSVQILVERGLAAILAGLQQGRSLDELGPVGGEPLDGEARTSLRAVMRLAVTSIRQALGDAVEGSLEIKDALEVEEPASDPTWLDGSRFERARFQAKIEGTESSFAVLFPDESAEEVSDDDLPRMIVVGGDPEDEAWLRLQQKLRCEIETVSPAKLRREGLLVCEGADAILIPWELGGTPGIDLLERLVASEATSESALVMMDPRPTRDMVLSALSAGATSFLMEPLEADELRERTGLGGTAKPEPEEDPQP